MMIPALPALFPHLSNIDDDVDTVNLALMLTVSTYLYRSICMSISPTRQRLDAWFPALLLIAGSVAFIGGGSRHPHVNSRTMPMAGSDEYFRHFASTILSMPNWEFFHTLILIGPVLWALGAAGYVRLLPQRGTAIAEVGRTAMLMGAGLWALAFVLDGFVAPRHA